MLMKSCQNKRKKRGVDPETWGPSSYGSNKEEKQLKEECYSVADQQSDTEAGGDAPPSFSSAST